MMVRISATRASSSAISGDWPAAKPPSLAARQHQQQRLAAVPRHRLQEGLDREFLAVARLQPQLPVDLLGRVLVFIGIGEQGRRCRRPRPAPRSTRSRSGRGIRHWRSAACRRNGPAPAPAAFRGSTGRLRRRSAAARRSRGACGYVVGRRRLGGCLRPAKAATSGRGLLLLAVVGTGLRRRRLVRCGSSRLAACSSSTSLNLRHPAESRATPAAGVWLVLGTGLGLRIGGIRPASSASSADVGAAASASLPLSHCAKSSSDMPGLRRLGGPGFRRGGSAGARFRRFVERLAVGVSVVLIGASQLRSRRPVRHPSGVGFRTHRSASGPRPRGCRRQRARRLRRWSPALAGLGGRSRLVGNLVLLPALGRCPSSAARRSAGRRCVRRSTSPLSLSASRPMLGQPDDLVGEAAILRRHDAQRRHLAPERVGRLVGMLFDGRSRRLPRQRLARPGRGSHSRQHQAERLRIDRRHRRCAQRRSRETLRRHGCGHRRAGRRDRRESAGRCRLTGHITERPGPGIAPRQQAGDVAIRIEPEDLRDIFERASDDIGRLGADGIARIPARSG